MIKLEKVVKELKKVNAKRVFVQVPDGLRWILIKIAEFLEKNGFEIVLWGEHTYGACDIPEKEAKMMNCDTILHIGHEDFGVKSSLKVVYYPIYFKVNVDPFKKEVKKLRKFKRICLISSVQFVKEIEKAKKILEKKGFKVIVPKICGIKGMILGCSYEFLKKVDKNVDCYLVISSGKFHGLGIALKSSKEVFVFDVEKKRIESLRKLSRKYLKIIEWNKQKFKEAKTVGLLISSKIGQFKLPFRIKKKIEKMGKNVFVIFMNEITPEKLEGMNVDVFVNCACPRIGMEDTVKFRKPLINVDELFS